MRNDEIRRALNDPGQVFRDMKHRMHSLENSLVIAIVAITVLALWLAGISAQLSVLAARCAG